ncbi:MAG: hypothetical protein ACLU8D_13530 [Enterocloster sp.]
MKPVKEPRITRPTANPVSRSFLAIVVPGGTNRITVEIMELNSLGRGKYIDRNDRWAHPSAGGSIPQPPDPVELTIPIMPPMMISVTNSSKEEYTVSPTARITSTGFRYVSTTS